MVSALLALTAALFYAAYVFNRLRRGSLQCALAWERLREELARRRRIAARLADTTGNGRLAEAVSAAPPLPERLVDPAPLAQAERAIGEIVEELGAAEGANRLVVEAVGANLRVAYARRFHNESATTVVVRAATVPGNLIAALVSLPPHPLFEA
jgi:hypothetical protein